MVRVFFKTKTKKEDPEKNGFTLVELLIVVVIIAVIALFIISAVRRGVTKAHFSRTLQEFRTFEQAMLFYLLDNDDVYPADVSRNIPPGLETYLGGGDWPLGAYPGAVYDWDNIPAHGYIQVSLRFCEIDGSNCNFPDEDWAENFDHQSSMYWCFEGACRAHPSRPVDHPGYCVNCE